MDGYPQELVDRIIDHLYNDHLALAASAAAYRRFLDAAHHHLFVHARLRSAARCRAFLDVLDGRPGLGAHVRYLAVDNTQDDSRVVLAVLAALVPHLTSVDALSLRAFDFRTAGDAPWAAALARLPVREAYVYMCTFADVCQAGRLLRCFPALEEFDFWWNEWEAREPAAALRPPVFLPLLPAAESAPLQHLRVVSLGDCPAVELVAWLLQTRSAASVRVLSFNLAELELVRACAALLAAAAGAVEQLCIDCVTFPQVLRPEDVQAELSLAGLDGLRALTIQQLTVPGFAWLVGLLETIPWSARMREVELALVRTPGDLIEGDDEWWLGEHWGALDDAFTARPFDALERLTLSFYSGEGRATPDEGAARPLLPRTCARVVLSVVDIIC